jgi:hypothetical protein
MDIGRTSGAVTISGTEDLGGGLRASFTIQQGLYGWTSAGGAASTSLTGNTLQNFGDRQVFLTLSGGFGSIKVGRDLNGASSAVLGVGKVDGTRAVTGFDDNSKDAVFIGNVRSTSVSYTTPTFNGFNAYVGFTPQNYSGLVAGSPSTTIGQQAAGATALGTSTGIGAMNTPAATSKKQDTASAYGVIYSAGPIAAALDITEYQESFSTLGTNGKTTTVAASYNFGVARVGAIHQRAEADTKADTKSNMFSVSVPVSSTLSIGAATGKRKATTNGAFSALETKHNQLSANYNLSKRTALFFTYSKKNVAGSTVDADDAKETGVGIAHSF